MSSKHITSDEYHIVKHNASWAIDFVSLFENLPQIKPIKSQYNFNTIRPLTKDIAFSYYFHIYCFPKRLFPIYGTREFLDKQRKYFNVEIEFDVYNMEDDEKFEGKIWILDNDKKRIYVQDFDDSIVDELSGKKAVPLEICNMYDLKDHEPKFTNTLLVECEINFMFKKPKYLRLVEKVMDEMHQDQYNYFGSLFNNKFLSDVVLSVGTETFHAHKNILSAHSEYFRKMFSGDFKEKNEAEVKIEDDPKVFPELLKFIYTFDSLQFNMELVLELIGMAYKYAVDKLVSICIEYFLNNLSDENCIDILLKIEALPLTEPLEKVIDYISNNIKVLSTSQSWKTLEEENSELGMRIATRAALKIE